MVKQFIFDSEQRILVPNPEYINSEQFVPLDDGNTFVLESEDTDDIPGGSGSENLQPPDTFIISQNVRNNSDGTTSIDITIDIDDNVTTGQYEVRVTRA